MLPSALVTADIASSQQDVSSSEAVKVLHCSDAAVTLQHITNLTLYDLSLVWMCQVLDTLVEIGQISSEAAADAKARVSELHHALVAAMAEGDALAEQAGQLAKDKDVSKASTTGMGTTRQCCQHTDTIVLPSTVFVWPGCLAQLLLGPTPSRWCSTKHCLAGCLHACCAGK